MNKILGLFRKIEPIVIFALISIVILSNLSPVLTLDMVFPPYVSFEYKFYGLNELYSVYVDTELPLYFIIDIMSQMMPWWLVQKIILFSIFLLSGISAYCLCPTEQKIGKYYAGFLYMINPLVYVRLMAGHWKFMLGYAILPFIILAFLDLLGEYNRLKFYKLLFWITLGVIFSIHIFILLIFILIIILIFKYGQTDFIRRGKDD